MSKFKVGDRVKSKKPNNALTNNIGVITRVQGHGYMVARTKKSEGAYFYEEELESIDRVRITVEREVNGEQIRSSVRLGNSFVYLDELDDGEVEFLRNPIVLPTKKYALVQVAGFVYVFDGGDNWHHISGNYTHSVDRVTEIANYHPSTYRVIFEGED